MNSGKGAKRTFLLRRKCDDSIKSKEQSNSSLIGKKKRRNEKEEEIKSLGNTIPENENENLKEEEPMLWVNRSSIFFKTLVNVLRIEEIVVKNTGSSAVYYDWVRNSGERLHPMALQDEQQKLFTHSLPGVILPGEHYTFEFLFVSQIPGIFVEEYVLKCMPELSKPLPVLKLTGEAYLNDSHSEGRLSIARDLCFEFDHKFVSGIIADILEAVQPTSPPPPDLSNQAVLACQFEKANKQLGLWYHKKVHTWYADLAASLGFEHWDLSVSKLALRIQQLQEDKQFMKYRLQSYLELSRKRPLQKSPAYSLVSGLLSGLAVAVSGFDETTRKQLQMWDWSFREPKETDAEAKADKDELDKVKAEWLKKAKKKKWGEEEERALLQSYRNKMNEKVRTAINDRLDGFESKEKARSTQRRLTGEPALPKDFFYDLYRTKCVRDIELDGRRVMFRAHLELQNRPNMELAVEEFLSELRREEEEDRKREESRLQLEKLNKDKKKKKGKKSLKGDQTIKSAARRFDISKFLDGANLNQLVETIKLLIEKQAKVVFLMITYGPMLGTKLGGCSTKFFYKYLKERMEFPIEFVDGLSIQNFEERLQNQTIPENSAIFFQNPFFDPLLVGYNPQLGEKPFFDDRYNFRLKLNSYSDVFVNENKFHLSITSPFDFLPSQQYVAGQGLSRVLSLLGYVFWEQRKPTLLVVGGQFTYGKLLVIQTMIWKTDQVVLVGRIGVLFYMAYNGLKELCGIQIAEEVAQTIRKFRQVYEGEVQSDKAANKSFAKGKLVVPVDLMVSTRTDLAKGTPEYAAHLEQNEQPLGPANSSKEFLIVDNGQKTTQTLLQLIDQSKKVVIIDSISPKESYKRSALKLYKKLYEIQKEKQERHNNQKEKDYAADKMIVLIGAHEEAVNDLVLEEVKPKRAEREHAEGEEEQPAPEEEEDMQEAAEGTGKAQNITLVQDFLLPESSIATQILSGKQQWCLNYLQKYDMPEDSIEW